MTKILLKIGSIVCLLLMSFEGVKASDGLEEGIGVKEFPKVGPIIRYITPTSITLMGQGDILKKHLFHHSTPHDNLGVAALRQFNGDELGEESVVTFPMKHKDRHVGHLTLDSLKPGQKYVVRIGYLSSPDMVKSKLNFENCHVVRFCTPKSDQPEEDFSILTGSCRRIGRKTSDWAKEGDHIFKGMETNILNAERLGGRTDSIAFTGDQIYADAMGMLFPAKTFYEYGRVHEKAFSQEHFRSLAANFSGPIHMTRDDHELWNDANAEEEEKYPEQSAAAHKAYSLFQRPFGKKTPHFWYTTSNGAEMFFTDTRSERRPSKKQLISEEQLTALTTWLSADSRKNAIKIIVTSVPIFLLSTEDAWNGYPEQYRKLLDHIISNNIKHVMFISGDAHCQNDGMFHAYKADGKDTGHAFLEVLVSGLFAVARNKAGLLGDTIDLRTEDKGYLLKTKTPLSPTLTENLFARISGNNTTKEVTVEVFNQKNERLRKTLYNLS